MDERQWVEFVNNLKREEWRLNSPRSLRSLILQGKYHLETSQKSPHKRNVNIVFRFNYGGLIDRLRGKNSECREDTAAILYENDGRIHGSIDYGIHSRVRKVIGKVVHHFSHRYSTNFDVVGLPL